MNKLSWIWIPLALLFGSLSYLHWTIWKQADISVPQFHYKAYKSSGEVFTYGPGLGDGESINALKPLNNFAIIYEKFINNDFANVVRDMNTSKRISNKLAFAGHLLASITCLISFCISRKE